MTDEFMVVLGASEISADVYGFQALATLHEQLETFDHRKVGIDCSRLRWIDAQLGTCLLTIVNLSRKRGNEISLYGISPKVQTILQKNKTLTGSVADRYGTTIPVTKFELDAEVEFSKYCSAHLLRPEVPKMSKGLREKFLEGLDELFANSSLHSKSSIPVFSGGQFFPNRDRLTFVISDGGRGINGSLEAAGFRFPTVANSIEWAMQMNNSARSGDIPGGLGLGILQEFVRLNEGSLIVCSQTGYWEMRAGRVSMHNIRASYPGTAVSLEINTRDTRSYHMKSRVNPKEIW
ncbi:STAS domain-containing protein [Pseudooceanicola marinus]|uniref:STAS domain-containing protein n=1 Tax=Pseudooceanicola marinus TaxID=396013 RepID=UPI001CD54BBB|nr:hypothetical protein [Pseudooceanicola marinus]MCA1334220.1 hypothetical protein [Pseudooceanicola marinus]